MMLNPETMRSIVAGGILGLGSPRAVSLSVTNLTGSGGDISLDLKPQTNDGVPLPDTVWIVQHLIVYHDDGTNRAFVYFFNDGKTSVPMANTGSVAANTYQSLFEKVFTKLPFYVSETDFLSATCYSLASTKKIQCRAVVLEIQRYSEYLARLAKV